MKDLTQGSVAKHLLQLASFIAVTMAFQTLYYLVDLYFVAGLGPAAVAGVSLCGNLAIVIMALTQMLGVGASALIAQAAGRKDQPAAQLVFNQVFALSAFVGVVVLLLGFVLRQPYLETLSKDPATIREGAAYLLWFAPALSMQFALVAMGAALRGTGVAKPTMVVGIITVVLNCALAPVLIAGWGTGRPLGVAGAGIATFIAICAGVAALAAYFARLETFVTFDSRLFRPNLTILGRILNIGIPSGGEFILMSFHVAIIYWIIRDFGPQAQAGYGIGSRVMQSIFLPVMAISFAVPALAGQNFGARKPERVRQTMISAAWMGSLLMASVTLLCQISPATLIRFFSHDAAIVAFGADYLRIIALNFVASGLVFTFSGMFQALGNTWPSLASSFARLFVFAIPAVLLSRRTGFEIHELWYLAVFTGFAHATVAYFLLRRELQSKLAGMA
ncbi:MAG: MATE family efflux transporter [Bryobacteraceae bacterium]|nr:MATE family efflux transporter [Bryobacteraceae bacterium]